MHSFYRHLFYWHNLPVGLTKVGTSLGEDVETGEVEVVGGAVTLVVLVFVVVVVVVVGVVTVTGVGTLVADDDEDDVPTTADSSLEEKRKLGDIFPFMGNTWSYISFKCHCFQILHVAI